MGAISGKKKWEIEKRFDEIVAFSEIEKFIDTPVKRYSSGMYVRLAFAVAAHLEPEILIVDEVLAVGDIQFQKKCLGKMNDVSRAGRTVLFVSHSMAAIKALCTRAILVDSGMVTCDSGVDKIVDTYLNTGTEMATTGIIPDDIPRIGTGEARIRSVKLTALSGEEIQQLCLGQPFRVRVDFEVFKDIHDAVIEVSIAALDGMHVVQSSTTDGGRPTQFFHRGKHSISAEMEIILLPRVYTLILGIHHFDGTTMDFIEGTLKFTVLHTDANGGDHYRWTPTRGYVRPLTRWCIK